MSTSVFSKEFAAYLARGFSSRRTSPNSKACKDKGWQKPDSELPEGMYDNWASSAPSGSGIALLLGTELSDGTYLAALDIDRDDYVRLASYLLGNPVCARFGSKGILYFVRTTKPLPSANRKLNVTLDDGTSIAIGEFLGSRNIAVIPPTVHKDTGEPYRWVGKPLLETELNELPLIEV